MMEKFEVSYLLIAILGMFIHKAMKVLENKKKNKKFEFKKFFTDKMNYVRLFLTIASVIVLMLMADDVGQVLGITLPDGSNAKTIVYLMIGYSNHGLLRNILKIFSKRIEAAA